MDYEKKYKEALERAREWYNKGNALIYADRGMCEIFPELAESKDEKIRKSLIALVRQSSEMLSKQNQESMIDWLEKHTYTQRDVDDAYLKGVADTKNELERQGEKLPVGFYYVNSNGEKFYSDTFKYGDVVLHVKNQDEQKPLPEDCVRKQVAEAKEALYDKPRWSEEDDTELDIAIHQLELGGFFRTSSWLKSLKQRLKGE